MQINLASNNGKDQNIRCNKHKTNMNVNIQNRQKR